MTNISKEYEVWKAEGFDFSMIDGLAKPAIELCGWAEGYNPGLLSTVFNLIGDEFQPLEIKGGMPIKGANARLMLFETMRKVLGKETENYGQMTGDPFVAGTKVAMANGDEKNIEDIKVGEVVINHKGEKAKVTNVIKRNFSGNLVTIQVKNWDRKLTATDSHHGMVISPANEPQRTKFGDMRVGDNCLAGNVLRPIENIEYEYVEDYDVYCITTENEYTAIFNGIAQFQCVSFSAKNSIEYVQIFPMANGEQKEFKKVFPPYLYGAGRVFIGGGRLSGAGSLGIWQAKAVMEYGTIPMDTPGLPAYNGRIADQWGARPGPPQNFVTIGKQYIVKSAALVKTWDEAVAAILNGYPISICSNAGFDMKARADGFHHNSTRWAHAMTIIGIDNIGDSIEPHACVLNSWGCYSDDTEILTELGWMKFTDLPQNIRVATLNQSNDQLEYQFPTHYHEYDYNGEMYNFISSKIDQLVTPNHNVYHRGISYRDNKPTWKLARADSLINNFEMKKDCEWEGEEVENHMVGDISIPMDIWLEFLGYFISEGYTSITKRTKAKVGGEGVSNWGYGRKIGICQQKIHNLDKIQTCLDKMPFKCHKTKDGWVFTKKALYEELKCLGKSYEKFIPSYVKGLSRRQQKILFDALMLGDGSYSDSPTGQKVSYYTSSKQLADDMQELLLKIGYAGDISSINRIGRENTNGVTRYIEYRIGIKMIALTPCKPGGWNPILIPYNGKVYCVTVPNGVVYVRRNGKSYWSGNSAHGVINDFRTKEAWPAGTLRVRKRDIEKILAEGDSFAYSSFDGFPAQSLPKDIFSFI